MKQSVLEGPTDNNELPKQSLGSIFYEGIQKWESCRIAVVDADNQKINYGTVLSLSVRVAKKFVKLGVGKNDVVTVISHNQWQYLATILAGFYVGATVNPLNYDYSSGELKHFFSITKPAVVFCTSKTLKNLLPLKNLPFYPAHVITYDKTDATSFTDFLSDVDESTLFTPLEVNTKEDVALILTSSGTTGLPKCVQLTHANYRLTMIYAGDPYFLDINNVDSLIGFLPFFHIFGNALALASILYGAKFVIMDAFRPENFLNAIQEHRITKLFVVPPVLLFLAKSPLVQKYDLSSINDVMSGAAPATRELEEMVEKTLSVKAVRQVYGMTEVCGAATIIPRHVKKYGSSGKVTTTHQIKVVDVETEKTLPPHKIGELRFKGDGIMKEYLANEIETQSAFDESGFLKSGDLGYYDEDGYFYIVDRLKEIIKYKGFQVSPAELESLLIQHPSVKDAGVVGKKDERSGEVPVAFVVKQPNQSVTEEELTKYVAENVSSQKHLYGGVIFIDAIPKSTSGKILRRHLKELI